MVKTICPSLPMRMNALGTKTLESAAAAARPGNGSWRLSIKPPLAAAAACRNLRRERPTADPESSPRAWSTLSLKVMCASLGLRGLLDGFANAQIGSAAADIAGHGVIYVGICRMRLAREQRGGRHDLAR